MQGKILAAKYARENKIPYLGICLGMQIAVIEFARSVMNLREANSMEFDPDTTAPVVIFMPEVIRKVFFVFLFLFLHLWSSLSIIKPFLHLSYIFCVIGLTFRVPRHTWEVP